MEAGADLRHRDALAGEILWRLQPGGVGVVAGEIADQGIAGLLAAHAADHLQRALAGEIIEPGGERRDAEIDVARGGRHRDRLRRVEEFQLDIEPGLAEIALVLRDEDRRRRRQPEHADLRLQRLIGARRRAARRPIASKPASAASRPIPLIRFLRLALQAFGDRLVPPDKGALLFQGAVAAFLSQCRAESYCPTAPAPRPCPPPPPSQNRRRRPARPTGPHGSSRRSGRRPADCRSSRAPACDRAIR